MEKPRIRNEYRLAWRKGDLSEIPEEVVMALEQEFPHEKGIDTKEPLAKKVLK